MKILFLFKVKMRYLKKGILNYYYVSLQASLNKAVKLRNSHFKN